MEGKKKRGEREDEKEGGKVKINKHLTCVASFWRPSRGPTSTMVTRGGRSAPKRRCFFRFFVEVAREERSRERERER